MGLERTTFHVDYVICLQPRENDQALPPLVASVRDYKGLTLSLETNSDYPCSFPLPEVSIPMDASQVHKRCLLKRSHDSTENQYTEPMDLCHTRLELNQSDERPYKMQRNHAPRQLGARYRSNDEGDGPNSGPHPVKNKLVRKTAKTKHLLYCECTECHNVSKCTSTHVHSYKTGAEGRILQKNKGAQEQRKDKSKPRPQCKAYKCHDLKCTAPEHRHFPFKTKFHEDGDFFVCSPIAGARNHELAEEEEILGDLGEESDFQEADEEALKKDFGYVPTLAPPSDGLSQDEIDDLPSMIPPLLRREYTPFDEEKLGSSSSSLGSPPRYLTPDRKSVV